jgi:hypothetical protein
MLRGIALITILTLFAVPKARAIMSPWEIADKYTTIFNQDHPEALGAIRVTVSAGQLRVDCSATRKPTEICRRIYRMMKYAEGSGASPAELKENNRELANQWRRVGIRGMVFVSGKAVPYSITLADLSGNTDRRH